MNAGMAVTTKPTNGTAPLLAGSMPRPQPWPRDQRRAVEALLRAGYKSNQSALIHLLPDEPRTHFGTYTPLRVYGPDGRPCWDGVHSGTGDIDARLVGVFAGLWKLPVTFLKSVPVSRAGDGYLVSSDPPGRCVDRGWYLALPGMTVEVVFHEDAYSQQVYIVLANGRELSVETDAKWLLTHTPAAEQVITQWLARWVDMRA